MFETVLKVMILDEAGKAISKVNGRHNYVIRMEMNDSIAYAGGMGTMEKCGLMGEFLSYMTKHGTCWAEYTYKKDFLEAVKALENNGFKILWQ